MEKKKKKKKTLLHNQNKGPVVRRLRKTDQCMFYRVPCIYFAEANVILRFPEYMEAALKETLTFSITWVTEENVTLTVAQVIGTLDTKVLSVNGTYAELLNNWARKGAAEIVNKTEKTYMMTLTLSNVALEDEGYYEIQTETSSTTETFFFVIQTYGTYATWKKEKCLPSYEYKWFKVFKHFVQTFCNNRLECIDITMRPFEPAHEILALFVLRKLILQTRMRSHPMGLHLWFLVGPFVYFHTLCERTADAQASLSPRWSPMW